MIGSNPDQLVDEDEEELLRSGVLDDEPEHPSPLMGDEDIDAEVLPGVHGSALFTRGESQTIATAVSV